MSDMKKVLKSSLIRYIILSVLAIVIGISLFSINAASLTGNAVPMPFGIGMSTVLSGSMEPEFSVGDLLIIKKQDSYSVNDIVVYQSGRMPVVHRIIDISDDMVTTKGDANNTSDEPFLIQNIKGEVVAVIPWVGNVLWAIKTPVGFFIVLAAAILLVELSFRKGKAEKEDEKEKLKAEIDALKDALKEE